MEDMDQLRAQSFVSETVDVSSATYEGLHTDFRS